MKDKNILLAYETKKEIDSNTVHVTFFDYSEKKIGAYSLNHTNHSNKRSQQRGIINEMIFMAAGLGDCTYKQGLAYYAISEKARKQVDNKQLAGRLKNLVIVMNDAKGTLITCYKNKNGARNIAKKKKRLA